MIKGQYGCHSLMARHKIEKKSWSNGLEKEDRRTFSSFPKIKKKQLFHNLETGNKGRKASKDYIKSVEGRELVAGG